MEQLVGLSFVLVVSTIIIGLGLPIIGRLDRAIRFNVVEHLAIAFLLGCFVLYLGVFAVGLFRLDGVSMWSLIAVFAVLAIPGLRSLPWGLMRSSLALELDHSRTHLWTALLWLAVLLISASSLVQGMAPPNDYDSLNYILTLPRYDVEMGRISVAWDRAIGTELFPAMAGNLSRLALATVGDGAAQMLHGMLGIVAAVGTGLLAHRMGCSRAIILLSVLFFVSARVVVWQMGTVETDLSLAAFTVMSIICYLEFRKSNNVGAAVAFGLLVGGGILAKYNGFLVAAGFVPLILADLITRRTDLTKSLIGPVVAVLSLLPHMTRNYLITENPIFPLFNSLINPDKFDLIPFAPGEGGFGTGKALVDLIITPWNMFVFPMHLFDGMIFGSPYLLVFAPLILLNTKIARQWLPAFTVATFYYVTWFYFSNFQVRFLLPIIPVIAAVAAVGAGVMWTAINGNKVLLSIFLLMSVTLGINQAMFVGIYSIIRLPASVGLMNAQDYHSKTPTMDGARFGVCSYIQKNLNPGEQYFSIIVPHSYYCPQAPVVYNYFPDNAKWWNEQAEKPAEVTLAEFVRRSEKHGFKYFLAPSQSFSRRNATAKAVLFDVDLTKYRYGRYLQPVFKTLKPLYQGPYSVVYDGPDVIAGLKVLLAKDK